MDVFYSRTNHGKKLLSATTNTTFYYIPPAAVSRLIENKENQSQSILKEQFQEISKNQDIENPSATSSFMSSESSTLSQIKDNDEIKSNIDQEINTTTTFTTANLINDKFEELKPVSIHSEGGCNQKQGLNTLQLTLSLSERYLFFLF